MKTLQLGQTYPTRDGKGSGRVVCDDLEALYNFGVVLKVPELDHGIFAVYSPLGRSVEASDEDLIIPERKMRTVWLNVYEHDAYAYSTSEDAKRGAGTIAIAIAYPVEVPAE